MGLARTSGHGAICARHNAVVSATETRGEGELGNAPVKLREAGVALELGGHTEKMFLAQDLIIPSPGVPANDPFLKLARSKGITVWSRDRTGLPFSGREADRHYRIERENDDHNAGARRRFLKAGAVKAFLAGNVGTPLIGEVEKVDAGSVAVAELSSFQLELVEKFRPNIGALLNLTPDHLDRHETMEAYATAKAKIFANTTELDAANMNADDAASAKYAEKAASILVQPAKACGAGSVLAGRQCIMLKGIRKSA